MTLEQVQAYYAKQAVETAKKGKKNKK